MKISPEDLGVLARYARLDLDEAQKAAIRPLFDTITAMMQRASELDHGNLAPTQELIARKSEVEES